MNFRLVLFSDVVKIITYKAKTLYIFQDQDLKNGMRINSLSLIANFL